MFENRLSPRVAYFTSPYFAEEMSQSFSEINFSARPKGYAVFVWSMKRDKCDFDRLILVRSTSTCAKAQGQKMSARKKYLSRWGKKLKSFNASEGVAFFDNEHDAYAFAYTKKAELEGRGIHVNIQKNQKAVYRVYCHELEPSAWSQSAFKKQQSPSVRAMAERHSGPIYYVGQTELSPSIERARNHVNPDHKHSTKWGEHHFKGRQSKDELKRWHLESLTQVQRFQESSGCPVENLTYGQALLTEAKLAQWLKDEGYPAYFA